MNEYVEGEATIRGSYLRLENCHNSRRPFATRTSYSLLRNLRIYYSQVSVKNGVYT
jgi:hypothetical protein